MRRLREVMADPEGSQTRLDRIARLIAANMVAEVCSVYVARPGEVLELFATEGLNPSAIHQTTLKVGEGLVGVIAESAEPLALAEAQSHPQFAYRPETGEEAFHSFLGVPVLRGGHTLGVLVVQNVTPRRYSEEEVEALETTAMVIAELIAAGELGDFTAVREDDPRHERPQSAQGEALSDGIALGRAVLHEPRVLVERVIAEDPDRERERLRLALDELRASIDRMLDAPEVARSGEHRDVLEAYRMFAHDRGWARKLTEAIETGLTAEAAVERVQSDARARLLRQTDPYMRERLHDLDDLARRLLRHLAGRRETLTTDELADNAILIARNMGPAELLDYDRARLRGLVIEETSQTSHVAIVARALRLPAVGGVRDLVDLVDEGDPMILDGGTGDVFVRPSAEVEAAYLDKLGFHARRQAQYAKLRDVPAVSRDGVAVDLMINAGLLVDLPHLEQSGAGGIGLFRTELQFMIASRFPRLGEQTGHYRAVLDAAGDRPVVFRSLDIGSDKMLPYLRRAKEDNPALGWRALRMALERPGLLRLQLRALLRAATGRHLRVMFPLVAEAEEFFQARDLFVREVELARHHGHPGPSKVSLGVMIEVPSILWQLDRLLPHVDFASVGSNDLSQFLFASDRGHPRLAGRYDPLSLAMLRVLDQILKQCAAAGVPLSLCGEMAGRPLEALALLGLGYRTISMAPASVGPVKDMLRAADLAACHDLIAGALNDGGANIREELAAFAKSRDIPF
jgi:phosphotransferase system enzyme I (PtsP)